MLGAKLFNKIWLFQLRSLAFLAGSTLVLGFFSDFFGLFLECSFFVINEIWQTSFSLRLPCCCHAVSLTLSQRSLDFLLGLFSSHMLSWRLPSERRIAMIKRRKSFDKSPSANTKALDASKSGRLHLVNCACCRSVCTGRH